MKLAKEKRAFFMPRLLSKGNFFNILCFITMESVLNALSEYTYFYILKNITSFTFVACF